MNRHDVARETPTHCCQNIPVQSHSEPTALLPSTTISLVWVPSCLLKHETKWQQVLHQRQETPRFQNERTTGTSRAYTRWTERAHLFQMPAYLSFHIPKHIQNYTTCITGQRRWCHAVQKVEKHKQMAYLKQLYSLRSASASSTSPAASRQRQKVLSKINGLCLTFQLKI